MCLSLRAAGAAMLAVLATFAVQAQTTLDVGLRHNPPFVIATEGQAPSGLAVALWNDIAADLGHEVNWVPKTTVGQMLSELEAGQLDVAVGAVTVTADRESRVDFSHPYFRGGIGIATRQHDLAASTGQALRRNRAKGTGRTGDQSHLASQIKKPCHICVPHSCILQPARKTESLRKWKRG